MQHKLNLKTESAAFDSYIEKINCLSESELESIEPELDRLRLANELFTVKTNIRTLGRCSFIDVIVEPSDKANALL